MSGFYEVQVGVGQEFAVGDADAEVFDKDLWGGAVSLGLRMGGVSRYKVGWVRYGTSFEAGASMASSA